MNFALGNDDALPCRVYGGNHTQLPMSLCTSAHNFVLIQSQLVIIPVQKIPLNMASPTHMPY